MDHDNSDIILTNLNLVNEKTNYKSKASNNNNNIPKEVVYFLKKR